MLPGKVGKDASLGSVRWHPWCDLGHVYPVARWHANDRTGTWRSSARDAPGVARALNRLGKRIRTLRIERKLTQEQAAELAKLDEKHWQDVERARTNPTVATLVGIARALSTTLAELFELKSDA